MLCRQGFQATISLSVELNEHQIPNLQDIGIILINQLWNAASSDSIKMYLCARATWALVSHFPKVVLGAAGDDSGFGEEAEPELAGFLIRREPQAVISSEISGIEAVRGEVEDVGEELPSPGDGFFFEVVAERPVAEHFEEGVVVVVFADVIEVVVLASSSDALFGFVD